MFKTFTEKYLSSAAFYRDADNENGTPEKTPAQLERDKIQASMGTSSSETNDSDNGDNEDDDAGESDNEDDGGNNTDKDDNEDDDKKNPPENETDEQKAARLVQEKEERRQARVQRRIDKLTADNKNAKEELERLRAQLAEKPEANLTEEEVERRAEEKAAKKLQEKQAQDNIKDFEKRCDVIHEAAVKLNKDFEKNVNEMAEDIGKIPEAMIYALSDLDNKNGHVVLDYLANPDNVEEMEELYKLSPTRMAQKLVRLSDKLKDKEKPAPKRQSAVPPAIETINEGNNRNRNTLPNKPTQNMDDFVRIRNQQEKERREARGR